ncbi:hypothetical protein [Paracidovorax wautersii]|uniref:hypothetical protein n=1 Tax=Paracidovorax wautersii TaxID=1177982 RepID=UPI0031E37724
MKKQATTCTTASQARRGMGKDGQKLAPLLSLVLQAARRRCDDMQDGPEAREAMKHDVMATPAALLPDLLAALSTQRIDRALFLPTPTTTEPKE